MVITDFLEKNAREYPDDIALVRLVDKPRQIFVFGYPDFIRHNTANGNIIVFVTHAQEFFLAQMFVPHRNRTLARFKFKASANFFHAVVADNLINIQLKEKLNVVGVDVFDIAGDIFIPILPAVIVAEKAERAAVEHETVESWYQLC